MVNTLGFHLAAVLSLLPAAFLPLWRAARPAWQAAVTVLAAMGPTFWVTWQLSAGWHTGFSATLWVAVATSALLFFMVTMVNRYAWRLAPLIMPYLAILGVLATIYAADPGPVLPMEGRAPPLWLVFHILVSVVTYGLLTVSAVAALAAFLQERALKRKRPTRLTRLLPPVADSERVSVGLLAVSEAVLGLGLISGMAVSYFTAGTVLVLDHKTLLSFLAFAVIGGLLAAHRWAGVRGRVAARYLLLAYLLLTLAFPGIKFISAVVA
ncbi:cytochrome c biogenesis protein CcsA [uncultured Rhodospira sp.]|uniref:cytochrome C assembly family protein n=1 Tax=uncultured Rhodospira sp. TaxID=1936189 RepID=UPI0026207BB8|nr:cytochrome c biogenesis protein CcsA [uncultured Rhodospira sp.]